MASTNVHLPKQLSQSQTHKTRNVLKYCAVLGCKNSGTGLQVWKRTRCQTHKFKIQLRCGCPPPFVLYPFPNSEKLRKIWLFRIGLPELEISGATCICGIHFLDGRPTSRSFFPTLFLHDEEDELVGCQQEDIREDNEDQFNEFVEEEESEPGIEMPMPIIQNTFHFEAGQMKLFMNDLSSNDARNTKPIDQSVVENVLGKNVINGDFHLQQDDSVESESSLYSLILPQGDQMNGNDDGEDIEQHSHLNQSTTIPVPKEDLEDDKFEEEIEVLFESNVINDKALPLAQYDPNAETLQITDPVKYIMECHNKIAQLVSENEKLRRVYIADVNRLKAQNKALQRKLLRTTRKSSPSDETKVFKMS